MTSLNSLFDGIYCINLAKCIDRKKNIEKEFQEINSSVTFIDAISPLHREYNALCKTNKVDKGIELRCFCLGDCKHYPRKLRETEIAISMSHYKAYHKIVTDNVQLGLIIEDDIQFHPDVIDIIKHMYEEIEKRMTEPCIIFCGGRNNPNLSISDLDKFHFLPKSTGVYSNYCYILNNLGAKKLVKYFYPINRPEDSYKRYIISKGTIKCYHLIPSIVSELSAGINAKPIFDRLSKKESIISFQKALKTTEKVDISTIEKVKPKPQAKAYGSALKPKQLKPVNKYRSKPLIVNVKKKDKKQLIGNPKSKSKPKPRGNGWSKEYVKPSKPSKPAKIGHKSPQKLSNLRKKKHEPTDNSHKSHNKEHKEHKEHKGHKKMSTKRNIYHRSKKFKKEKT